VRGNVYKKRTSSIYEIGITMANNRKKIYVILSQTGTVPARIIKFFTGAPYNHASLSTDSELQEIYSFCRKFKRFALPAGFVEENRVGVFDMFNRVPCEIYAFEVSDEQYQKYQSMLDSFKKDKKLYSYNVIGLIGLAFGLAVHRKNHFVCSQFVAHILSECKIAVFNKDLGLVKPDDFRYLDNAELVYKGDMKTILPLGLGKKSVGV